MRCFAAWLLALLCWPVAAFAHVGSKDVFEQVTAGAYTLFVTIRMPNVIPGVATVEVKSTGATPSAVNITPLPLTGEASKHPPTADAMIRSTDDPAFFTGGVWMMAPGSWQVRLDVSGSGGSGTASVPVVAVAISALPMQRGLAWGLTAMGLFLMATMAGIVAAAVREARLQPGVAASPALRRRGLAVAILSIMLMAAVLYGGAMWWKVDAASYAGDIYRPLHTEATLSGDQLELKVSASRSENVLRSRANDDFLPDHGHLMHLYAIRQPEMDAVLHLHPAFDGKGDFSMKLPAMPPGTYALYGDVVHANGFPETLVTRIDVPSGMAGAPLAADDARSLPPSLSKGQRNSTYPLPDGYQMLWDKPAALTASTAYAFHFRLLGPDGKPATDVQPYMGMAGHAAFVKTDGTVFAHTHPEGSVAMASLMLANGGMEGMAMPTGPLSNAVDFPYGFPTPGAYRILVQMKHGALIVTGVFDASVAPAAAR